MATELAKAYVQIVPSADGIKDKLEQSLGKEAESAGTSAGNKILGGIGSVLKGGAAVIGAGISAAMAGAMAITKEALSAYGEYEQLVGGVETLFGDAEAEVMEKASNAYKNAGMSANEYMTTVTALAASLKQSTADEYEAASYADMAIVDMADNANKMGSSLESIQNAYQGFAKQNYTMLDNLKLGYGGTKEEMERLLADANELNRVKLGESWTEDMEYNIDSLADIVDAIHLVQENMGITGTTAKEAGTTIQGSIGQMKSAWTNLLSGMADESQDIGVLITNLVTSIVGDGTDTNKGVIGNIIPAIMNILPNIVAGLTSLVTMLLPEIPPVLMGVLPALVDAAVGVLQSLIQLLPDILSALMIVIPTIVDAIITMLPLLLDTAIKIIAELALGLAEALPTLIPTIVDVVLTIVDTLVDNIDLLVETAITFIFAFTEGIISAVPILIEKVPIIFEKFVDALIRNFPLVLEALGKILSNIGSAIDGWTGGFFSKTIAAIQEFMTKPVYYIGLGLGTLLATIIKWGSDLLGKIKNFFIVTLPAAWNDFIEWVKKLPEKIVNIFLELPSKLKDIGKNLVAGLKDGIVGSWSTITDTISNFGQGLIDGFKNVFGIHSPSKEFAWIGQMCDEGLAEGLEGMSDTVKDAKEDVKAEMANDMAFNTAISASGVLSSQLSGSVSSGIAENNLAGAVASAVYAALNNLTIRAEMEPNTAKFFDKMRAEAITYQRRTGNEAWA